jgi:putative transcriptional regulator
MMKITHHISEELLLDYSSGALSEAWSIAVAAHLSKCSRCRATHAKLEEIGGLFLTDSTPEDLSDDMFGNVLIRLGEVGDSVGNEIRKDFEWAISHGIPAVVADYLATGTKNLPWKSLGLGVSQVVLETKDKSATARLLKIPAGKKVPHHSHNGRELTVIFSGGFTDETGIYGPGDIQEIHGNAEHQPWVREEEDCICLAVTEAPLKFSNVAVRLAQPLIGI